MALRQVSTDIRDCYDITNNSETTITFHLLELRPPVDCEGTTGLDALIVVLRRVYASFMLGPDGLAQKDWYKKSEQDNPILKHAWHVMGDSLEERAAAGRSRADLISILSPQINAVASFKELCTCPLMNSTFWSQPDLSLHWPILRLPSGGVVHQGPEVTATESLVILDREQCPGKSLQEAISSKFGLRQDGLDQLIYRPHRPFVVRVLLRNKGESEENRLEFKDIRHFLLPQWVSHTDEQVERLSETSPRPYTIVAVVKMRPGQSRGFMAMSDAVRTYSFCGPNITALYEDETLMSGNWSVGDLSPFPMEYMLFYMPHPGELRNDLSSIPEYAPRNTNRLTSEDCEMVDTQHTDHGGTQVPFSKSPRGPQPTLERHQLVQSTPNPYASLDFLGRIRDLEREVTTLRTEVASLKDMGREVATLKAEVASLKEAVSRQESESAPLLPIFGRRFGPDPESYLDWDVTE
ncbi:hypothetical protein FGADI_2321 [Fusarium gaditjirri]|uniref:Uncharacterized protein n=1 Tax=Fusarium gaditjirri TaxID=282569 RepID=A0A8H4TII9_9HYPO|nr:hypothetical protein FGADI_2321 [Fusarium gaditjirri]